MPLEIPNLDNRRYPEILEEALARIPVHNPEWTNATPSDPGVTLVQLFAFMTENLLYRANQIPERNRKKFLSLLGIGLKPAASARGMVAFSNEKGRLASQVLETGLEVRAGQVPFRLERALEVLPVEALVYYKKPVSSPDEGLEAAAKRLYTSFLQDGNVSGLKLYQTTLFDSKTDAPIDVGADTVTVDGSLWIALLARKEDKDKLEEVRETLKGKTLSVGLAPLLAEPSRDVLPGEAAVPVQELLRFGLPQLSSTPGTYRRLEISPLTDVLREPGIVEVGLGDEEIGTWNDLEPLEAGVGDLPPALEDTALENRLITWLRFSAKARFSWVGINAGIVQQEDRVFGEALPDGNGEPDQEVFLSRRPVLPGSVKLSITLQSGEVSIWEEIEDLFQAGSEVPTPNSRNSPSEPEPKPQRSEVFSLDPEAGKLRFGDGVRGARPPREAKLRVDYHFGLGQAGNLAPRVINNSPDLPPGFSVMNPIRTWGGADAQTIAEAEKGIPGYLRHRDRLVSKEDFEAIVRETPGVTVGRVDVLPAYHPKLALNVPGGAPGAVTLMVIPRYDPVQPDAPKPDAPFLDAICHHLEPRRLITTELYLRAPEYVDVYISLGLQTLGGYSPASVREKVKADLRRFLSPLPDLASDDPFESMALSLDPRNPRWAWPREKAVLKLELLTVASRVEGVQFIDPSKLLLGTTGQFNLDVLPMRGLQLPRIVALSVTLGDPVPIAELLGQGVSSSQPSLPVPVLPQECK